MSTSGYQTLFHPISKYKARKRNEQAYIIYMLYRRENDASSHENTIKTHSKENIIISGNFPIYANHVDTRAICCQNTYSQILFFSRGDATIILHLATPFPVTSQAYV